MPHRIHKINSYQVQANDEDAEMSGHLRMVQRKAWRKMWFVVKQKVLYTFKASEVRIEPSTCCMLPHSCKFSLLFGLNINLLSVHEEHGACRFWMKLAAQLCGWATGRNMVHTGLSLSLMPRVRHHYSLKHPGSLTMLLTLNSVRNPWCFKL